jgi:hypothetical protein
MEGREPVQSTDSPTLHRRPSRKRSTLRIAGLAALTLLGAAVVLRKWYHHKLPQATPISTTPIEAPIQAMSATTTTAAQRVIAQPSVVDILAHYPEQMQGLLKSVEEQLVSTPPSNKLYALELPDGPVRWRIVVAPEEGLQVGSFHLKQGITICHDGAAMPERKLFIEGVRRLAARHDLRIQMNVGGLIDGCNPVDFFADL